MGAGATVQGSESEKQVSWLAPREKLLGLLKGLTMWVVHELVWGSSLEVVFPPLWWCRVQGTGTVPCFCSRHLRNGSWFVAFLYLIVHNCPNCEGVQLCLVCYSFFVFYCSRRYLSRWKHSSKGSQVPAYQNRMLFFCVRKGKTGFPGSLAGKESTYNAGDSNSISGSGSSPGEGIDYPLQYSWAFLVAQMVKNPSTMWKTSVWSLGWEDPLEEGMATHYSILCAHFSSTYIGQKIGEMFLSRVPWKWNLRYRDGWGFFLSVILIQFSFFNHVTVLHILKEDKKANLKTKT